MKILIRAVNWIGDAVMSEPALRLTKAMFPEDGLYLLAKPPVAQLFAGEPYLDGVMVYDKSNAHKGLSGLACLVRELKKEKFDMAILFQNAFEAAVIAYCAGIGKRVGYKTDMRGILLTDGIPLGLIREKHQVCYYMNILKQFSGKFYEKVNGFSETPRLTLKKGEAEQAVKRLMKEGVMLPDFKGEKGIRNMMIGINPGATYGTAKMWKADRFAQVADSLAGRYNATVIIFGGPQDTAAACEVKRNMKSKPVDLSGKTSIRELLSIISLCTLFITNDTGPMHIAAAFGVPVVAVFGSTDHKTTSPFGDRTRIVRKNTDCAPCLKRTCSMERHECMEAVTTEDVLSEVEEFARNGFR